MPRLLTQVQENALIDWVKTATGLPGGKVIWDKPSISRPALPYATLDIPTTVNDGRHERKFKSLDTWTISIGKLFTLNVQVISDDNHMDLASQIGDAIEREGLNSILLAVGIVAREVLDITDVSALLNTKFEPRGSVDVMMNYVKEYDDNEGEIQSVTVTGQGDLDGINPTIP